MWKTFRKLTARLGCTKGKPKRTPLPQPAVHPDPSTLCLDELLGNRQTQPGSIAVMRPGNLEIPLEDPGQVPFIDTLAMVLYPELDGVLIPESRDFDTRFLRRVLDGIGEQVDQYPGRLLHIRLNIRQIVRELRMYIDTPLLRLEGDRLYCLVDDRRRVRRLQLQLDITRLHLRHVQQLRGDLQQPVGIVGYAPDQLLLLAIERPYTQVRE